MVFPRRQPAKRRHEDWVVTSSSIPPQPKKTAEKNVEQQFNLCTMHSESVAPINVVVEEGVLIKKFLIILLYYALTMIFEFGNSRAYRNSIVSVLNFLYLFWLSVNFIIFMVKIIFDSPNRPYLPRERLLNSPTKIRALPILVQSAILTAFLLLFGVTMIVGFSSTKKAFWEILGPLSSFIPIMDNYPTHFRKTFPWKTQTWCFFYGSFIPAFIILINYLLCRFLLFSSYWKKISIQKACMTMSSLILFYSALPCIVWVLALVKRISPGTFSPSVWHRITLCLFLPAEYVSIPLAHTSFMLGLFFLIRQIIKNKTAYSLSEKGSSLKTLSTLSKKYGLLVFYFLVSSLLTLPRQGLFIDYAPGFPIEYSFWDTVVVNFISSGPVL